MRVGEVYVYLAKHIINYVVLTGKRLTTAFDQWINENSSLRIAYIVHCDIVYSLVSGLTCTVQQVRVLCNNITLILCHKYTRRPNRVFPGTQLIVNCVN